MDFCRFFFVIAALLITSCAPIVLEHGESLAALASSTPSFHCSYYLNYDSLAECQTNSQANCTSEWKTFPTGGVSLCYKPVPGYETCNLTPPTWNWLYTPYSNLWCDTGTVDGSLQKIFQHSRSLIGCSSGICLCTVPIATLETCAGTGLCPASLYLAPTPFPCPP